MRRIKMAVAMPILLLSLDANLPATAQQASACPPRSGRELHSRVANGTNITWTVLPTKPFRTDLKGEIELLLIPDLREATLMHVKVLQLHEEGEDVEGNRFALDLVQGDQAEVQSTLRCTETNPPKLTLTYVLNVALTATSSDGTEKSRAVTRNPVVQSVELRQEQPEGVSIGRDCGRAGFALSDEPVGEERLQGRRESGHVPAARWDSSSRAA